MLSVYITVRIKKRETNLNFFVFCPITFKIDNRGSLRSLSRNLLSELKKVTPIINGFDCEYYKSLAHLMSLLHKAKAKVQITLTTPKSNVPLLSRAYNKLLQIWCDSDPVRIKARIGRDVSANRRSSLIYFLSVSSFSPLLACTSIQWLSHLGKYTSYGISTTPSSFQVIYVNILRVL